MIWFATLKVPFLVPLTEELEDPVVLDFDVVFEDLFFEENQWVHLAEKLLPAGVITLEPEVLTPDHVL